MPENVKSISEQFLSRLQALADKVLANGGYLLWDILVALLVLALAKGLLTLISHLTGALMRAEKYHRSEMQGKRMDTMLTLLRSVARYLIYFIALMLILRQFGIGGGVAALLGAAGIGSLAIGFGAKNLVQDVVTGFFMIFENQFTVGDYIKIDDVEGFVVATAMRVTYLRSFSGDQIIVPNGTITRVVNFARGSSVANVTISTAYEADTRAVIGIIQEAMREYAQSHGDLIDEPPVVLGVSELGASSVDIGITCKARPLKHWEVGRGIRLAVKEKFDSMGVEFPYPHMVTVPYETKQGPIRAAAGREETIPDWASGPDEDDS